MMEDVNLVTLGENAQASGLKNTKGGKSSKSSTQRSSTKSVMARLKKLRKTSRARENPMIHLLFLVVKMDPHPMRTSSLQRRTLITHFILIMSI
jgi:hypothetical protein